MIELQNGCSHVASSVIYHFIAIVQKYNHLNGSYQGIGFIVESEQESGGTVVVRIFDEKILFGKNRARDRGLYICSTTPIEIAGMTMSF